MRGVKIVLGIAAIVQFAGLCAVLGVMLMQEVFIKPMMRGIRTDAFAVPYASLISVGLSLLLYVAMFSIAMTAEEGYKSKAVISLICLAVLRIICSYAGIVVNMIVATRNGAEVLALHSTVESYASMWAGPFTMVALILFCFGMGRYYACQDSEASVG